MEGPDYTVQRFWNLPYRWKSSLRRDDQVFSQLHLLHPKEPGKEANQKVQAELILVAGLGGHYRDTWRATDGTFWPQDLLHLEHYGVGDVRVWSFEYNTTLRGSSHLDKVDDHARELLGRMMIKLVGNWIRNGPPEESPTESHQEEEESTGQRRIAVQLKPIIFVGHSLGGMLIKKAMLIAETEENYKILWQATRGAMFFAVPHHGLDRQDWKNFVTLVLKAHAPVPGIRPTATMEEQAAVNGKALLGITHDFRRLQEFLFFVNYTEGRLMPGLTAPLIAEGRAWMDAPRKFELQLDGDHLGICKFEKGNPQNQITGRFDIVVSHLKHLMGASKALEHIGDEAKAALESLCPTGFHGYFMAKQATVGTCGWIAERKEFKDWAGNKKESRMLWIQGPPASGKSFLTRHIITDLIPQSTTQKVAHCFLDDSVPGRRRLEHLLRATLHHALRVEPELIHHYLVPPYLKAIHASDADIPDDDIWTLEVLVPIWPEVVANVTSRGVLTVVVDGFSEMSLDCQQGFLDCLDDFKYKKAESEEQRDRLKVLLVSREDAEAEEQLEGREEFEVYRIRPEDVQEDIEKTVMATVTANPNNWDGQDAEVSRQHLESLDPRQVEEIRDTIISSSGGNFLLAKMKAQVVSESLALDTPDTTMALVKELPNDIAGMYDETLKRVQEDSTYLAFVRPLLRWATFQMEPLMEAELNTAVALAMAHDQAPAGQLSKQKLESLQHLVGNTKSIIEKHGRGLVEIREGILQPVDALLKERLTKASNEDLECMDEGPSHAALANTCISYLTMEYFEDSHEPMADSLEEKVKKRIEDHAFSRYAALYWMDHVEAAGGAWQGVDDHVILARRALEDETTHYGISCSEIRWFLTKKTMKGYPSGAKEPHTTAATAPRSNMQSVSAVNLPNEATETIRENTDGALENETNSERLRPETKSDGVVALPPKRQPEANEMARFHSSQRIEVPFEAQTHAVESYRPDSFILVDNEGTMDIDQNKAPEFHWQVETSEAQDPLGLGLFERDVEATWKSEDIVFDTEPDRRESADSGKQLEPHAAAEEVELSTKPVVHEPIAAPQHRVLHDPGAQEVESATELERQYEPGSFYNRLQENPDLLDLALQGPYVDGGPQDRNLSQNEIPPRKSLPLEIPEPLPLERALEPQIPDRSSEVSIPMPKVHISTPHVAIPTRQIAFPTPEVAIPTPELALPVSSVNIDPTHSRRRSEDQNAKAPSLSEGSRSKNKGAKLPQPKQNPKFDYPLSQAYPTTSTSRHEGHGTVSIVIPRNNEQSWAPETRGRSSLQHHGAAVGPSIPRPYDQTGVRESRDQHRGYQYTEADDGQHEEDSGPEESVLGDGTKKKKRHIFRRALDKTKKIVKGVGRK